MLTPQMIFFFSYADNNSRAIQMLMFLGARGCLFGVLCFRLCKLCWDSKLISCLGHVVYRLIAGVQNRHTHTCVIQHSAGEFSKSDSYVPKLCFFVLFICSVQCKIKTKSNIFFFLQICGFKSSKMLIYTPASMQTP